jgi:hypothetical protein
MEKFAAGFWILPLEEKDFLKWRCHETISWKSSLKTVITFFTFLLLSPFLCYYSNFQSLLYL